MTRIGTWLRGVPGALRSLPAALRGLPAILFPRPERRSRGDILAALAIVVAVCVAGPLLWFTGDAHRSRLDVASHPWPAPVAATSAPTRLTVAWRARNAASPVPATAAGVVAVADGGTVRGLDPRSGDTAWSYRRDREVCGISVLEGMVVAVFRSASGCGQVTGIDAATGRYAANRSSEADDQISLLRTVLPGGDGGRILSSGPTRLEVWRPYSEGGMIRTLEYGRVTTQVVPNAQPRPGCRHLAAGFSTYTVAVLERCPEEPSARLTILESAPESATEPKVTASSAIGGDSGAILGVGYDVIAVAESTPEPRIAFYGINDAEFRSAVPLRPGTPGDTLAVGRRGATTGDAVDQWWDGRDLHILDPRSARRLFEVEDALGTGARMGADLLVPVVGGIAVVDPLTGTGRRVIPVDRAADDPAHRTPVHLAVLGGTVLEQRGDAVAAYVADDQDP